MNGAWIGSATATTRNASNATQQTTLLGRQQEPTESFALRHYETARAFLHDAHALRQQQLQGHKDQLVITEYYKA